VRGLADNFTDLKKQLKMFKNKCPNNKRVLLVENFKMEINQANHYGHISEISHISLIRASGRFFKKDSQRRHFYHRR
jgi:hypothetical protein